MGEAHQPPPRLRPPDEEAGDGETPDPGDQLNPPAGLEAEADREGDPDKDSEHGETYVVQATLDGCTR